ncbi:MAG: O-acetyl-ADP-ribose deacetylase [Bacillota bacterium]
MQYILGETKITILKGDITRQDTEAIVNAANSSLMGGGGVDGAIHRAGGAQILEECKQIVARQGPCPTGKAVLTGGGRLRARYVIHTVGPVWRGGGAGEDELLRRAYLSCLDLAAAHGISSLSFPAISTGAYRFPKERAARIALATVAGYVETKPFTEIRFVLFGDPDLAAYLQAARALGWTEPK